MFINDGAGHFTSIEKQDHGIQSLSAYSLCNFQDKFALLSGGEDLYQEH